MSPARAGIPDRLDDLLQMAQRRFVAARLHFGHGTHSATQEAAWLASHALGVPPGQLPRCLDQRLTHVQGRRLLALIERRVRERIPAAYLTREAWLGDLAFHVDRRVIVPRSFIAELLRDGLQPWLRAPVRRALDLCTGSACLAVLLARAFHEARIDATDVSAAALAVARKNIGRHRLQRRIALIRGDLFRGLVGRRYDLMVANPPYVTERSMRTLPREYRHEPALALAGGRDGLAFVHRILAGARGHLTGRGILVCEIGHNRAALERAYPRLPFTWLETSAGPDFVFLLERDQLPRASTGAQPAGGAIRRRAARSALARG